MDCLFQCVRDKLRVLCGRCFPTDNPIGNGIDDESHVDKTMLGRDEREVGYPQRIWLRGAELSVHLIQRTLIRRLTMGGFNLLTAPDALDAKLPYQPLDGTARDRDLLALHRMPQLARAVDGSVLLPNILHLLAQMPS